MSREAKVERYQPAPFAKTNLGQLRVQCSSESLLVHGQGVVTCMPEKFRDLRREIFVDLELHAWLRREVQDTFLG